LFCLPRRRPPPPTLFPYTTLFRSRPPAADNQPVFGARQRNVEQAIVLLDPALPGAATERLGRLAADLLAWRPQRHGGAGDRVRRSEEHTSELQSLAYLVCRLLLEK